MREPSAISCSRDISFLGFSLTRRRHNASLDSICDDKAHLVLCKDTNFKIPCQKRLENSGELIYISQNFVRGRIICDAWCEPKAAFLGFFGGKIRFFLAGLQQKEYLWPRERLSGAGRARYGKRIIDCRLLEGPVVRYGPFLCACLSGRGNKNGDGCHSVAVAEYSGLMFI